MKQCAGLNRMYRVISSVVSMFFFVSSVNPVMALDHNPRSIVSTHFFPGEANAAGFNAVGSILVPQSLGLLKEIHQGTDTRLVIHIQDLHANEEAQKRIGEIVRNLAKEYWIGGVFLEGAEGMIDIGSYRDAADRDIREKVGRYLLKEGMLTGAEYEAIVGEEPIQLYGAEELSLHEKNLEEFRAAIKGGKELKGALEELSQTAQKLKWKLYSEELKDLDKVLKAYHSQGVGAAEYFNELKVNAQREGISLEGYENLRKLLEAQEIEKGIDYQKVDQEKNAIIQRLSQELPKEKLQELVRKTLSLRLGKETAFEYYEYLENVIQEAKLEGLYKESSNFKQYLEYIKTLPKANPQFIFEEAKALETAIKDKLLRTEEQKTIDKLSRNIDLLKNFFTLTLTSEDLEEYRKERDTFKIEEIIGTLKRLGADGELDQIMDEKEKLTQQWM